MAAQEMNPKDIMIEVQKAYWQSTTPSEYSGALEHALKDMYLIATGEEYDDKLNYEAAGREFIKINGFNL